MIIVKEICFYDTEIDMKIVKNLLIALTLGLVILTLISCSPNNEKISSEGSAFSTTEESVQEGPEQTSEDTQVSIQKKDRQDVRKIVHDTIKPNDDIDYDLAVLVSLGPSAILYVDQNYDTLVIEGVNEEGIQCVDRMTERNSQFNYAFSDFLRVCQEDGFSDKADSLDITIIGISDAVEDIFCQNAIADISYIANDIAKLYGYSYVVNTHMELYEAAYPGEEPTEEEPEAPEEIEQFAPSPSQVCEICNDEGFTDCHMCGGLGYEVVISNEEVLVRNSYVCPVCKGKGWINDGKHGGEVAECGFCDGGGNKGSGEFKEKAYDRVIQPFEHHFNCNICNGTGKEPCFNCTLGDEYRIAHADESINHERPVQDWGDDETPKKEEDSQEELNPQDKYISILDKSRKAAAPILLFNGDKWPCSNYDLENQWKKSYVYLEQILGPACDDIQNDGLEWVMTKQTLSNGINQANAAQNTIELGTEDATKNLEACSEAFIHEAAKLWLQQDNEALKFNCGPWFIEASAGLSKRILVSEGLSEGGISAFADLYDYVGWEALNGTSSREDKACISFCDEAGSMNLYYMDTVLSTPGTYDYWVNVNRLCQEYADKNKCSILSDDALRKILDEAAGGRSIDGLTPAEWLFSRNVANTKGSDGTYLTLLGNYDDHPGDDYRVNVYAFVRKGGKETGLAGQKVTIKEYDAQNRELRNTSFTLDEDGLAKKQWIIATARDENGPISFAPYSAIRIEASANISGKSYTATNYTINLAAQDTITYADNRMFFILTGENGQILNLTSKDISVDGGEWIQKSSISNGLLIVKANQGDTIKLRVNGHDYTFSKPAGARVSVLK